LISSQTRFLTKRQACSIWSGAIWFVSAVSPSGSRQSGVRAAHAGGDAINSYLDAAFKSHQICKDYMAVVASPNMIEASGD